MNRTSQVTLTKGFQESLGKDVGKAPCIAPEAIRIVKDAKGVACQPKGKYEGGLAVAAGAPVLRQGKLIRVGTGVCNRCLKVMKAQELPLPKVPKVNADRDPRVARAQAAERKAAAEAEAIAEAEAEASAEAAAEAVS